MPLQSDFIKIVAKNQNGNEYFVKDKNARYTLGIHSKQINDLYDKVSTVLEKTGVDKDVTNSTTTQVGDYFTRLTKLEKDSYTYSRTVCDYTFIIDSIDEFNKWSKAQDLDINNYERIFFNLREVDIDLSQYEIVNNTINVIDFDKSGTKEIFFKYAPKFNINKSEFISDDVNINIFNSLNNKIVLNNINIEINNLGSNIIVFNNIDSINNSNIKCNQLPYSGSDLEEGLIILFNNCKCLNSNNVEYIYDNKSEIENVENKISKLVLVKDSCNIKNMNINIEMSDATSKLISDAYFQTETNLVLFRNSKNIQNINCNLNINCNRNINEKLFDYCENISNVFINESKLPYNISTYLSNAVYDENDTEKTPVKYNKLRFDLENNISNINSIFNKCENLSNIDVKSVSDDIVHVTFNECNNVNSSKIELSQDKYHFIEKFMINGNSFYTKQIIFQNCENLSNSIIKINNTSSMIRSIDGCNKLNNISIKMNNNNSNNIIAFNNCNDISNSEFILNSMKQSLYKKNSQDCELSIIGFFRCEKLNNCSSSIDTYLQILSKKDIIFNTKDGAIYTESYNYDNCISMNYCEGIVAFPLSDKEYKNHVVYNCKRVTNFLVKEPLYENKYLSDVFFNSYSNMSENEKYIICNTVEGGFNYFDEQFIKEINNNE